MKSFFRILTVCIAAVLILTAGSASAYENPFVSPRGSCDSINGVTVLVAIFVDDPVHSWDFDSKADYDSYSRIYRRLRTAVEWLTRQVQPYGPEPRIIWDWYNEEHLYYRYRSSNDLSTRENVYSELRTFILDRIDLPGIRKEYGADNIIFIAYYNQDRDDTVSGVSWSWDFDPNANGEKALEIIWITDEDNGRTVSAAGLAYHLMHCFGATGLYHAYDRIPQAYVDHLKAVGSRDIMYHIDYSTPDTIAEEQFSIVDAYYMGMVRWCDEAVQYGLSPSSFEE